MGSIPAIQDYTELTPIYHEARYGGDHGPLKEKFRRDALMSLFPDTVRQALDVACGTGRGLLILKDVAEQAVGIDGTLSMLHASRSRLDANRRVSLCQANAASLPFATGQFDVVTCLNFVHLFRNLRDKQTLVGEIGRVLKPGAVALVEFDNAIHGLILGPFRKLIGHDIGYDWPWIIRRSFTTDIFRIEAVVGANLPFIWRVRPLRVIEPAARRFPVNYLANRLFVQARRTGTPWEERGVIGSVDLAARPPGDLSLTAAMIGTVT